MFTFITGFAVGFIIGFLVSRNNPNLSAANKAIEAGKVFINSAGKLIKKV